MSQYEVTQGPLTLAPGIIIRLNEQQATLRQHALKKRKDGAYEVLQPVQFKNGEVLGFDEIPNKTILSAFFSVEKIKEIQAEATTKQAKPAVNRTSNKSAGNQKPNDPKLPAGNTPSVPPTNGHGKD